MWYVLNCHQAFLHMIFDKRRLLFCRLLLSDDSYDHMDSVIASIDETMSILLGSTIT